MNYRRNFRIAVLLDSPPKQDYETMEVQHPERGLIKGYWFAYTNFDDVLKHKPLEFLIIDEQNFLTYHGANRRIAEMLSDRELRSVEDTKSESFFLRRKDVGITWALW